MVKEYEPLYTVKEVSKILKINLGKVYELMKKGSLPYIDLGARKIRGKDLEHFINTYPQCEGNLEKEAM